MKNYYILEARYIKGHVLWLRFADGTEGEIDLATELNVPAHRQLDPMLKQAGQFLSSNLSHFFAHCYCHYSLFVLSVRESLTTRPDLINFARS